MTRYKLGRLPADHSKPRLELRPKIGATLTPPTSADWTAAVKSWPMNANDRIGDCTCAAASHIAQMVNRYGQGKDQPVSDAAVIKMYAAISGYDPKTGANDDGATCQDALGYWRKTGVGGNRIAAFAQIDANNLDLVRNCIALFGAVYIGMDFPDKAMDQFDAGKPWTVVKGARSDGGHCVPLLAYDQTGFTCVTWGRTQPMDLGFYATYIAPEKDVWAPIDPDWITTRGVSTTGLDIATLNSDYRQLTGATTDPFPTTQPTPAPSKDRAFLENIAAQLTAYLKASS